MSMPQTLAPLLADVVLFCSCDELQLDSNPKPSTTTHGTYSHAQKMQASMTYIFGCIYGLGSLLWHKNETTGKPISLSDSLQLHVEPQVPKGDVISLQDNQSC